ITNTPLGSASLTVNGSTWSFTANNSYAGNTLISGGSLLANGTIGGNALTNTAGTLGGSGTINCPVTINSGGTLQPGQGSSVGMLSINNTVKLSGKTVLGLNRTNAPTSSLIAGVSTLTCGGTLTVTNVADPLVGGEIFDLFNATTMS